MGPIVATPTDPAFDIAVTGLNVLATQNHTPVSSSLATGQPGKEYYLLCGFTPNGTGGPSSVQFRFLVNGQVVRDVQAPVQSGQHVAMGEFWTPPSAGTYTLVCEANPNKTFAETSYANNKQAKQFNVMSLNLDPSAVIKAEALNPSQRGEVSVDVAKDLAIMPDIRVQGLEVRSVDANGYPQATAVQNGLAGRTYYLYCVMEPVGQVASSSVRFVFRANGMVVRDVHAPVEPGTPVQMGWKWTPPAAGTYQLVCEANPDKTFSEATFANNLAQALFPVELAISPEAVIEAGPLRNPPDTSEKEADEKSLLHCPECFNPQPEPPGDPSPEGFNPDPPPPGDPRWTKDYDFRSGKTAQRDFEFEPPPQRPGGLQAIQEESGEGLPDLVPELKVQGSGVLFPLQILIKNESDNSAPPSRVRVTWHITCQKADGTSARTFPVGPKDEALSVPMIAPQQSYDAPGLTGPKQYCEAPPAAVRANLICAESCYVRALADADRLVSESDEGNNAASVEVERK